MSEAYVCAFTSYRESHRQKNFTVRHMLLQITIFFCVVTTNKWTFIRVHVFLWSESEYGLIFIALICCIFFITITSAVYEGSTLELISYTRVCFMCNHLMFVFFSLPHIFLVERVLWNWCFPSNISLECWSVVFYLTFD